MTKPMMIVLALALSAGCTKNKTPEAPPADKAASTAPAASDKKPAETDKAATKAPAAKPVAPANLNEEIDDDFGEGSMDEDGEEMDADDEEPGGSDTAAR